MARRVFTQTFGVVAAFIALFGKVLLVREAYRKGPDYNKWNHPAGWIEVGEDPLVAVVREAEEETGRKFRPTDLLGVYSLVRSDIAKEMGGTPHCVKLVFVGSFSDQVGKLHDDVSETRWFTPEEIYKMGSDELRDIDIKQMTADYFAGRRYPLELIRHITQSKT